MYDMDEMNLDKPPMQLPFAPTLVLLHHWFLINDLIKAMYATNMYIYTYLIIYIAT